MRMCREYMAMIRVIANRIVRNLPIQTVVPLMIMLVGAGCASDRLITTVYGKDYGTTINTRFRYNLVNRPDLQSQVERLQPNVFSRTGIPVEINDDGFFVKDHEIGYWDDLNGFTLLVYFASIGTLPTVRASMSVTSGRPTPTKQCLIMTGPVIISTLKLKYGSNGGAIRV